MLNNLLYTENTAHIPRKMRGIFWEKLLVLKMIVFACMYLTMIIWMSFIGESYFAKHSANRRFR